MGMLDGIFGAKATTPTTWGSITQTADENRGKIGFAAGVGTAVALNVLYTKNQKYIDGQCASLKNAAINKLQQFKMISPEKVEDSRGLLAKTVNVATLGYFFQAPQNK